MQGLRAVPAPRDRKKWRYLDTVKAPLPENRQKKTCRTSIFQRRSEKHQYLTSGRTMDETVKTEENPVTHPSRSRKDPFAQPASRISPAPPGIADVISFNRDEVRKIFSLYGRKVGDGEWQDYAIDFTPQKAVFFIYRRACEYALFRIEKCPRLAQKQGAYSVITATGLILKHGHDLSDVIAALYSGLKLVSG
jgi:hypothetical protein